VAAKCNAKWRTIHISSNSLPPCLDGERSGFRVASSGRPGARSGGPHTGRGSSLSSSPLNWRGRGLVPCAAHLALCFCCCPRWCVLFYRWRRCPKFHSSLSWNGTSFAAKHQRGEQQPTRPLAERRHQAVPLASPSPPPVQYPFPGLTYWLFSGLGHFLARDSGRNAH